MTLLHGSALRGRQLIGLDIGTTMVRAARIRRRGTKFTVAALSQAQIEASHKEGGQTEKVALAMLRCLRLVRDRRGEVTVGLSGPEVAVRTFEFPRLPRRQIGSAIELEAMQVCPFDMAEASIAWQVLPDKAAGRDAPPNGPRIGGVFAAARNAVIGQRRALCEMAKVRCTVMDVDGLALLNCLEACRLRERGQSAVILNIGSKYTNLAIIGDDDRPYVRDIAFAGEQILSHVCHRSGAPREGVIEALNHPEKSKIPRERIDAPLKEACRTLAERVDETIRYYATTQKPDAPVQRVLLCGGLSQAKALRASLMPLLRGDVLWWNPLESLSSKRSVRRAGLVEHGPSFAVAIGLAIRTLRDVHD